MSMELERNDARVQDHDLFARLNHYLDNVDRYLQQGIGWFIFNARGNRSRQVANCIVTGLHTSGVPLAYQLVPWRDFALNAYMVEIELLGFDEHAREMHGHTEAEHDIATRISRDNLVKMIAADVLILTGVEPKHRHELDMLDQTVERRTNLRAATIIMTPEMPHELASRISDVAPDGEYWNRIFTRMYERSLVAM